MRTMLEGEKLRHVAGAFPTGIAVVSLMDEEGELLGMTINSFVSVSLDPPLLLFSAGLESRMLPYCIKDAALSVNILSQEQKYISDHFAGIAPETAPLVLEKDRDFIKVPGAMAWYETRIRNTIEAGDHKLVLCEIIDCGRESGQAPLVFYNGYRTVGLPVED